MNPSGVPAALEADHARCTFPHLRRLWEDTVKIVRALSTALLLATALAVPANAEVTTLNVSVFQGMQNLPLFAAEQKGSSRHGA